MLMWFDEKYSNSIAFRNVAYFISPDDRIELEEKLKKHGIGVSFFETRGIQASAYDFIFLYINQNLTELIIAGLLAPAAYDVIKTSILLIYKRIKNLSHATRSVRSKEITPSIQLKAGNAEIIAPIPQNLSDEQFGMYMDMLRQTMSDVNETKFQGLPKHQSFIAEYSIEEKRIMVKTITEYGYEQIIAQRKRQAEGDKNPPTE